MQIIESGYVLSAKSEKSDLSTTEIFAQALDNPHTILPGESVHRKITAQNSHIYRINLPSGQNVRLLFDAQNINLIAILSDPNQHKICESTNRKLGPTPISLISNVAGIYTLEVRMLGGASDKGEYELAIEPLRAATARDKDLIIAQRLIAEADGLRDQWKAESLAQSINKYEEAIRRTTGFSNPAEDAYALRNIGNVYGILGNNKKAAEYFTHALESSRRSGDKRLQIDALNDLASINIDLGKKQAIITYCDEAQILSKETNYIRGEARTLNNMGGLFSFVMGNKQKALDLLNQALQLYKQINDYRGQAQTLSDLGYTHSDMGNVKEALSYFNQALQFWQALSDSRGGALTFTAMGLIYNSLGEPQRAFDYHDKAIQLFQTMGNRVGQAITLNGLAYVFDTLSQNNKSLELYSKALKLYRAAGHRSGEAVTMGLIGRIYEAMGDRQKALTYHHQRLRIGKLIGNHRVESHALRDIGVVLDALGNKTRAMDYYTKSLTISRTMRDPRGEAYTLNCIGYIYQRSGQKHKALELYKQALALLRTVEDRTGEMLSLHNITRATMEIGDFAEACDYSKKLIEIVETLRAKVANQDLRTSYFASVHQHYKLYIDVLMHMHRQNRQAGYDSAALEISEKARGRSLLDLLNESGADIRQGIDQTLLQEERDLQRLLNLKARRQIRLLDEPHTEDQALAIKEEIADITSQYEHVRAKIRAVSPQYSALTQPRTLSIAEIQQSLDEDTVLLEYSLGDEQSYLWLVTVNSITSFELPDRAKIEAAAKHLYKLVARRPEELINQSRVSSTRSKNSLSEASIQLSRMLLGPVADHLAKKRLIIVADGALQYVPFNALYASMTDGGNTRNRQLLIGKHEIVNLPSFSIIPTLRKEASERTSAPKHIAILADPVFEKNDSRFKYPANKSGSALPSAKPSESGKSKSSKSPANQLMKFNETSRGTRQQFRFQRLPFSNWEAKAIAELLPQSDRRLILGFEANLATAVSPELEQYRVVHFATHALIYGAHPQLYGIVLSQFDEFGNSQDGFLRLNEIYNLKLPADLVVLSACQTAIGKEVKGEGLVGLTHGFMYAGATRVLASLWQVDDRASAELMKYFYEAMLGPQKLPPAAALQAAQMKMSKHPQWNSPYYWAGFLLQGEWR